MKRLILIALSHPPSPIAGAGASQQHLAERDRRREPRASIT